MEKLSAIQQIWGNFEAFQNMSFPLDARTLSDIQANTALSMAIGNIGGDRYYLVEPSAQTNWCGFAFLSTGKFPCGELLYIDGVNANGGILPNQLCLIEESVNVMGVSGYDYPNAYAKRKLVHGLNLGVQQFERNSFQPIKTNLALKKEVDDLTKKVDPAFYTPIGAIVMWIDGNSTPGDKWLHCDGRFVSKTEYKELYAIIGANRFGADSATEFRLPNMRGRFPVGYDSEDDDYKAVDSTKRNAASKTVTLEKEHLPKHDHTNSVGFNKLNARASDVGNGSGSTNKGTDDENNTSEYVVGGMDKHWTEATIQSVGENQGHENRPPYQTLAFIIRVK